MTFQPVKKLQQQKIYDLYMRSMSSSHHQTEYCGCGSAAGNSLHGSPHWMQ